MVRILLIVAFATAPQLTTDAEDIECFADGECTQSLFVDQWSATDAQECLETCRVYDGCEFFTFYGDGDDLCLALANCVVLDDKTCIECYSGNKTCPDLQCWVPGSCEGSTISADVVSREEECLDACQNMDGCNWLTFDEFDGACILFSDCLILGANECDTCWSSQVQCGDRKDFTKVLVVGGYSDVTDSYLDNVEVVDLSSESPSCDSVSNYPFLVSFPVGTVLDGLPTVCGGYNADSGIYTDECYQFLYEENRWILMDQTMIEGRYDHKSSMVDSATWLITGGLNEDGVELDSTEFYQNGEFLPGPFMPFPLRNHCQVTLNSSFVTILGGYNGTEYIPYFYLLDWKNEEWISMPDVPVILGNDPCGLIENSANGFELVVLRDYNECYIFNFRDMAWREGPNIPYEVRIVSDEMPVQMKKTFYIMGGYLEGGSVTDAIFKFDNENYVWNLETARLETARRQGVAIAVPDEMVNCN